MATKKLCDYCGLEIKPDDDFQHGINAVRFHNVKYMDRLRRKNDIGDSEVFFYMKVEIRELNDKFEISSEIPHKDVCQHCLCDLFMKRCGLELE